MDLSRCVWLLSEAEKEYARNQGITERLYLIEKWKMVLCHCYRYSDRKYIRLARAAWYMIFRTEISRNDSYVRREFSFSLFPKNFSLFPNKKLKREIERLKQREEQLERHLIERVSHVSLSKERAVGAYKDLLAACVADCDMLNAKLIEEKEGNVILKEKLLEVMQELADAKQGLKAWKLAEKVVVKKKKRRA